MNNSIGYLLARRWHAENCPDSVTVAHFAWRSARSLNPFRKILEFNFVFDANVGD